MKPGACSRIPDAQRVPRIIQAHRCGRPALGGIERVRNRVDVFGAQPALGQAPPGGQLRQFPGGERDWPLAMLAPAEPFLLGGRHHLPIHNQSRGRIVEDRVEAEYAHLLTCPVPVPQ